jgi:hypothetical protein
LVGAHGERHDTTSIAAIQRMEWRTAVPAGSPSMRARVASATLLTGLMSANHCSAVGIESTGTSTELAKVSGMTQMKPASWTASTFLNVRPTKAATHENAYPKATVMPIAARKYGMFVSGRNPIAIPTPMAMTGPALVRPVSVVCRNDARASFRRIRPPASARAFPYDTMTPTNAKPLTITPARKIQSLVDSAT